jgi:hypothetical protein
MPRPALSLETGHRSGSEDKVAAQLKAAGVEFGYENLVVPYTVPSRVAKYNPDFPIPGTNILIEVKGHFGGRIDVKQNSAKVRQKMLLVKEQHPEYDIRFVFDRASTKIYPGSPTTHAKWATDHGFKWADKGTVPDAWLEEIKTQQAASRRKS